MGDRMNGQATIPLAEINDILQIPKITTAPMKWKRDEDSARIKYKGALELESGESKDKMILVCQYVIALSSLPATLNLSFLYKARRVFAIDIEDESKTHLNRIGTGRTYFKKKIHGSHIHTWSIEGLGGYAEPLPATQSIDPDSIWQLFQSQSNIAIRGGFIHPLSKGDPTQGMLELR